MIAAGFCFLYLLSLSSPSSAQIIFGARTCLARCGNKPTIADRFRGECSCDGSCQADGNCCGDFQRFCSTTCSGRCGNAYHPLQACNCHDGCEGDGCCEDYIIICLVGTTLPETTRPVEIATRSLAPTPSTTALPIEKGYSFMTGREVECPQGIHFVSCPRNPCEDECERHPDATCLVNQCGTCEARYFDFVGNELDCYDPDKYCPDGQRIFDCGGENLCAGTSCLGFSRAVCVPNKCGGCYYDYVDKKGNIVNCELDLLPTSPCGEGVELLQCNPLPCAGQICAADITARCRNVMCGECRAEFYNIRENIVYCNATEPAVCPDECVRNPCSGTVCNAHPDAVCRPRRTSTCGKCEPSFVLRGKQLRDIDCVIPNECRDKESCDRNPCQMYTCPGIDVICIAQYCNGCNALFFNTEGRRLRQEECYDITTLDLPTCPDGKTAQICPSDLCLAQRCGRDYSPNCKPDECNNCELKFFDDEGTETNCEEEEDDTELCDDGNLPVQCKADVCEMESCPAHPEATCQADPCNYCKIIFVDEEMNELECKEQEYTTSTVQTTTIRTLRSPRGRCPSGEPLLACGAELCESAACEGNQNAVCKTNPCDNCKLMFFDNVGRLVNCDPEYIDTCEGRCGEARNLKTGCQCDFDCAKRDDCCSNFAQTCETCENRCGKHTAFATCQCTSNCRQKGNCCKDFADICLATKKCKGRCNSPYRRREICQCHAKCVPRRNCCLDYIQECA